jgi:hypothetical protein
MKLRSPNIQSDKNMSNETNYFTTRFVCIARFQFKNFFRLYLPIFDLLFVAIIPFLLMIFTNVGIIRTTMRSNILTSKKQKRNNRLTIMLFSVILAFMLLTCPSVIYICVNRLMPSAAFSDTKLVILDLLESLWYTKHALNFILYTLSGQDFRREFRKLISCSHRKTVNTLHNQRRRQQKKNNMISMDSYISSHNSPSTNAHLINHKKKQEYFTGNALSTTLYSNLKKDKFVYDGDSSIKDGSFGLLPPSSNIPSPTSMTSEQTGYSS